MEPCGNQGGPSPKAKYKPATDSELVPRGKGEKNPGEGSEIVPETVCLQAVEVRCLALNFVFKLYNIGFKYRIECRTGQPRAFCIMSQRVTLCSEVKP